MRCDAKQRNATQRNATQRNATQRNAHATQRGRAMRPLYMAASASAPVHAAHARRAGQVALRGNVDEAQVEQRALVSRQEAVVPRLAARDCSRTRRRRPSLNEYGAELEH